MNTMVKRLSNLRWLSLAAAWIAWVLFMLPSPASAGDTLKGVKSRGVLRCGVSEGILGFSLKGDSGDWSGLDADFCRAVAAAVLGDGQKVKFVPLTAPARFPALKSGQIDLLSRNTTWTLGRESNLGTHFAGTLYYDGQSFLVPRSSKARRPEDLAESAICVTRGSTHEVNLADYFHSRGLSFKPILAESVLQAKEALFKGECQAYTADASILAATRLEAPEGVEAYVLMPDRISKEPLGPAVNRGDEQWLTIVKWVLFALIEAEERGITRENVHRIRNSSSDPAVMAFLDQDGRYGNALGIGPNWVVRVIETVGNYGEMFERNLGGGSPLKLERGLNRLWTRGGLMYAPPFR
jgi:general L-amino acid transport system substrate-binding protein